jgi:hypothetical protein
MLIGKEKEVLCLSLSEDLAGAIGSPSKATHSMAGRLMLADASAPSFGDLSAGPLCCPQGYWQLASTTACNPRDKMEATRSFRTYHYFCIVYWFHRASIQYDRLLARV